VPDKLLIPGRPLLLCVARQHALQTDTHALDIVDWAPALLVQQVQTDDAVGVDVRVVRDRVGVGFDEGYFGGLGRGS
jgi:hypothetical protein